MIAQKTLKCLHDLGVRARVKPGRTPLELPRGTAIWLLGDEALEVLVATEKLREADIRDVFPDLPRVWIAGHIPERKAKEWIAENRAFADTVGNAFLNLPGLVIRILGNRPERTNQTNPRREWRGATLRLLFHLLCDKNLVQLPVRALANLAHTATGTVQQLLDDLEETGNLIRLAPRRRRLRPDRQLLDRWIADYERKLRASNLIGRFDAKRAGWHRELDMTHLGAKWGGEAAAEVLGVQLRPGTRTIYTAHPITPLLRAAHLHKAPEGGVEIRQVFWECNLPTPRTDVTPPLLIVADLLATRDGRCLTAAAEIRERFLETTA